MPRKCTVCTHEQREEIDRLLASNDSIRSIAARYSLSRAALTRHRDSHLTAAVTKAQEAQEVAHADNLMAELQLCMQRARKLHDACDLWLQDADDPTKYDIGPRAEEVMVTYVEHGDDGLPRRRKNRLSNLLALLEDKGIQPIRGETKYADPRTLVLKTQEQVRGNLEFLAKLIGQLETEERVNIVVNHEWIMIRSILVKAVRDIPYDYRQPLLEALNDADRASKAERSD